MIPPNAAERIREARIARCETPISMGAKTLLGFARMMEIETGKRPPTEAEWSVICAVMPEVLAPTEARKGER